MDLFSCLRLDHELDSSIPCRVQQQAVADLSQDVVEVEGYRQLCRHGENVAWSQRAVLEIGYRLSGESPGTGKVTRACRDDDE
jgi:hypothetical protein